MIADKLIEIAKGEIGYLEKSKEAVEIVQEVVGAVAPESPIATATGEDFDRLHITVRTLAHFAEFVLLGLFATWSCLSFSPKKGWLAAPACFTVATAVFDECLQKFTFGRASELLDVLADGLGGLTGFAFALLSVWLVGKLLPKNKKEGIKTPVWEANIYIKRY